MGKEIKKGEVVSNDKKAGKLTSEIKTLAKSIAKNTKQLAKLRSDTQSKLAKLEKEYNKSINKIMASSAIINNKLIKSNDKDLLKIESLQKALVENGGQRIDMSKYLSPEKAKTEKKEAKAAKKEAKVAKKAYKKEAKKAATKTPVTVASASPAPAKSGRGRSKKQEVTATV
jgi:hypothetical protein